MKKMIGILLMSALMGGMSSCEIESSDNGDLDGFWHLEQIDTLATGGTYNLSKRSVFWGVQHRLISINDHDKEGRGYYSRFTQTADSLHLIKLYLNSWHENVGGDVPLETVSDSLRACGINGLQEHFAKESLSGSKMVLRNSTLRLRFKKF